MLDIILLCFRRCTSLGFAKPLTFQPGCHRLHAGRCFLKRLGDSLFPTRDRAWEVHRPEELMKAAAHSRPLWLVLAGGFLLLLLFVIAVRLLTALAPAPQEDAARAAERTKAHQELEAENAKKLQNYAWVDKAKGTVQIPIERAMELAMAELNSKKPTAAGPIATPAPSPAASPAASPAPAAPPTAPAPAAPPAAAPAALHASSRATCSTLRPRLQLPRRHLLLPDFGPLPSNTSATHRQ
jgi:hypothetical protein